jgi:hypothetical protein
MWFLQVKLAGCDLHGTDLRRGNGLQILYVVPFYEFKNVTISFHKGSIRREQVSSFLNLELFIRMYIVRQYYRIPDKSCRAHQ